MPEPQTLPQGKETWAVDFDGTLATYQGWKGIENLGEPVPEMVAKVKQAIARGVQVYIFTARVSPGAGWDDALGATKSYLLIAQWCQQHLGVLLPITHEKGRDMTTLLDDRAPPSVFACQHCFEIAGMEV